MAKRLSSPILLPIFGGQGTLSFNPEDGSRRFRQLTSSPTGVVLLDACFDAFHAELASLPVEVAQQVDICANDFLHKNSLLCPVREEYLLNPIISGSTLLLLQVSSFLHYVESSSAPRNNRLDWLLQSNAQHGIGVLGFSSGIIAATVVAASRTKLDFIRHAVEAYRLAFWIGVRSQLFRMSYYASNSTGIFQDFRPWALVIFSLDRSAVQQALLSFNERVFITSVIDNNCVTVSGHPDDLAAFTSFLPTGTRICETNIVALYHVPSKLNGIREALLKDVASRGICFPTVQDLFAPVRSSFDGRIVKGSLCDQPLIQSIIDMVLVQPVNWEAVANCTVASIPPGSEVELLNIEMSKTLLKGLENSLSHHCISHFRYSDLKTEDDCSMAQVPIAIVGMAVKMPGAESVDDLWNILAKGLNTLEPIPADRFDYDNSQKPGRDMAVNTGNFVKSVGEFDNKFFGISPREAKSMDPQQRMLLHVAYEALENAGYVPDSTPTFLADEFGCFIGAATHDYVHNLRNDVDVYYSTGTLGAFLSGRLSYCLGLGGPSIVVDTACSSSLVAIHQATRALMNGDCKAALAGGVNVISSPDMFVGLDKGHFLSLSGGCKSFDASADGYSRAEGCGIFVLKRLCDAIAENDRILGVIQGIEVNQSGKAQSITHPHAPTQEGLFRRVLKRSGVKAHSVNFIEAHGPGTQAGDVNELSSLRRVFATDRPLNNPLYIGSLKANIGHLEAASGAASLAKVLLMLNYETIPAQISLRALNPMIPPLHLDNTVISTENISWVPAIVGAPRLVLINNFGAAGSNAAMVVEEYVSTPTQLHSTNLSSYVFGLSAKDDLTLGRIRTNLVKWLAVNRQVSLADLSYTLMARRQVYTHRLVVTAGTTQELISRLNDAVPAHVLPHQNSPVVFVFSGQGAQYHGMGSSLYRSSPLFKKHIDECDAILCGLGFLGILAVITGEDQYKDDNSNEEEATQTAMFALEYALAMVWMSWGIKPIALVGHSLGEYTALVIGGTLQLRDALVIIATRARLLFEKCASRVTGMLAVALEPEKLQCILDSSRGIGLSISCYNSPQACVVAGPISELTTLKRFLETEISCDCTLLDLPFAYHSPTMAVIYDDLLSIGSDVKVRPPSVPIVSTVFGRVYFPGDASFFSKDYFAKHCSNAVRFSDAIESYLFCPTLGGVNTVWLEIGPHSSLLPMLQSFPSLTGSSFVASLHKKQDSWTTISRVLASFYLTRTVDWRAVFAQIGPASVLSLPSYSFSPNKYWMPFREATTDPKPEFTLIRNWKQHPNIRNGQVAILETSTACLKPYIEGHRVGGVPLCPASIYLELAAAGVTLSLSRPRNFGLLFEHITFSKPLVLKNAGREDVNSVRLIVNPTTCAFSIDTDEDPVSHDGPMKHADGKYQLLELGKICGEFKELLLSVDISLDRLNSTESQHLERFSTRTIYDLLFSRVVDYSKEFHTIQSLTISPDTMEATAKVRLDKGSQSGHFMVHPLFLDSLVHIPGFMANHLGGQADIHICVGISSISLLPDTIDRSVDYTIYAKGIVVPDGVIYESYAVRNGSSRALVAIAKGIHFQRVHLDSLKASFASLVRATSTESGRVSSRSCVGLKSTVLDIIARNCNVSVDDISPQDDLDSLGVDSLMRLALRHDLASIFPNIQIPSKDISACRRVRELVDLVSKCLTQATISGASTPSQTTVVSSPDLSAHATQLNRIISRVPHDEDLVTDFGLDSLSCIEATCKFATQYKTHLHTNFRTPLVHAQSFHNGLHSPVEDEAPSILSKRLHHALGLNTKLWVLQTSNSSRTPLVLIHDGSGLAVSYCQISRLDRRLYGINNPLFLTSQTWSSITQIAESYANLIQEELDEPVILGGWSFGGVVAFELAKILQARSHPVKGVILIDSPDPFNPVSLSPELINCVLSTVHNISPQTQQLCKSQFMTNSQLLTEHSPHNRQPLGTFPIVFLRSKEGFNPPSVDNVPTWLSDRNCACSLTSGWTVLSGSLIQTINIPGNHFSAFDSHNVEETSRCIGEACEILDGNSLVQTSRPL